MTAKPVILSEAARDDERDAVAYYAREAGLEIALRFVDALRDGYRAVADRPGTGSPRFGHSLNLPGLRSRRVGRFPYMIFYKEGADRIDVWRVLHAKRDIPKGLLSES